MGQIYVSIKPFLDDTGDTYEADFIDVTEFLTVSGVTSVKQKLDNSEFDIGIFRHTNFNVEFNNTDGTFSKPGDTGSIFNFTRNNSIVRVEWEFNNESRPLGFHPAGNFRCSPRQLIGDFLLNDAPAKGRAITQLIKFKCLGMTTLLDNAAAPFATILDTDKLSEVIFKCLNQTFITRLLTVTQANIVIADDSVLDDKTAGDIENKTVTSVLKKLLLFANAVLYLDGTTVKVSSRTASAEVQFTFTGPGSIIDTENIMDINAISDGDNRIINTVDITDASEAQSDATSIDKFGTRQKSIQFKPITGAAKRNAAAAAIVTEFKDPLTEFNIVTPLNYDRLDLKVLDRIAVDYPVRVIPQNNQDLPIFGIAEFDIAQFPTEIRDVNIPTDSTFKILGITTDLRNETMTFAVRELSAAEEAA